MTAPKPPSDFAGRIPVLVIVLVSYLMIGLALIVRPEKCGAALKELALQQT